MSSYVPVSAFLPYVQQYLSENEMTVDAAAASLQVNHKILTGKIREVTFDTADRVICRTVGAHVWVDDDRLREIYRTVDVGTVTDAWSSRVVNRQRCARPGCTKMFEFSPHAPRVGPKAKKYCSRNCMQQASRYRTGVRRPPGETGIRLDGKPHGPERPYVCKRGHERTPENTKIRPDGTRVCRECLRASNRKAKERWRQNPPNGG